MNVFRPKMHYHVAVIIPSCNSFHFCVAHQHICKDYFSCSNDILLPMADACNAYIKASTCLLEHSQHSYSLANTTHGDHFASNTQRLSLYRSSSLFLSPMLCSICIASVGLISDTSNYIGGFGICNYVIHGRVCIGINSRTWTLLHCTWATSLCIMSSCGHCCMIPDTPFALICLHILLNAALWVCLG